MGCNPTMAVCKDRPAARSGAMAGPDHAIRQLLEMGRSGNGSNPAPGYGRAALLRRLDIGAGDTGRRKTCSVEHMARSDSATGRTLQLE